jgi:branched-chain amino acid transport system ATP-binding protein
VHVALGVAKGAYVLEGGRLRYSGTADELRSRPELLRSAYLAGEQIASEHIANDTSEES